MGIARRRVPIDAFVLCVALAWAFVFSSAAPAGANPATVMSALRVDVNNLWIAAYPLLAKTNQSATFYRAPTGYVFYSHSQRIEFNTLCTQADGTRTTASNVGGFYCGLSGDQYIYMDWDKDWYWEGVVGDYAPGAVFAHEWAHHIETLLVWPNILKNQGYRANHELYADCLAGIYTKWGQQTGILGSGAFTQGRNLFWSIGDPDGTPWSSLGAHGSSTQRLAWYDYGYNSYSLGACQQVWQYSG